MRVEIQRFTEAADASGRGRGPKDRATWVEPGRESELGVALEELRAQNDTLYEACARLERENAKYRDLYDSAPDALVTTDARGVIVDANLGTATLFGFPHEMLPGKLLIAFIARGDTITFRDHLRSIVEGAGRGSFSVRVRPRGGRPVPALVAMRVVHGTVRALDSRREPSATLHWTIHPDSEGRASVYDLLETAADELRAPVTTALGWSRLLRDGALHEPERAPAIAAIAESAQAQKTLLDQIAELVSLTKEVEPATAVSFADAVVLAADRARPAATLRDVSVSVERTDGGARTHAHADHLAWALDRLLERAVVAASSPGTVLVSIGAEKFHATMQVRASGAPSLGGSRLAVAVASAAIERQGGVLRVPEIAKDGLVLELRLPLASPEKP
jgi:PAS domain S-box-containing protein